MNTQSKGVGVGRLSGGWRPLQALLLAAGVVWCGRAAEAFSAKAVASDYRVANVRLASSKSTESRLYCREQHFLSILRDPNGAVAFRPHPGHDVNGWGSTWYPGAFLPGAVLRGGSVSVRATPDGVAVKAGGTVCRDVRGSFGKWTLNLLFAYSAAERRVSASGEYVVKLKDALDETTGDLNLCKVASNYLTDVPLLGGGTGCTGDTAGVEVTDDAGTYLWDPPAAPGFFPLRRTFSLTFDALGQYNNVDTGAQGYAPIAAAYKPSLRVSYALRLPPGSDNAWDLIPQVVLADDFSRAKVASKEWLIPKWRSPSDGTFVGRTQFRCSQNASLPKAADGSARVTLDTYNPTGYSFYGTDLIAKRPILLNQGVLVTVVARAEAPFARGLVGGIFLYGLKEGSDTLHDEIDFELLSNRPDRIQTNLYGNEPLGVGHPESHPFPAGSATDAHVYQILWLPESVTWYVDHVPIRTETDVARLPTGPMFLHINLWAPGDEWAEAYDGALQPTRDARANQAFALLVDSVKVETVEESPLIFGALYDTAASKLFFADNVGVTPLVLKTTSLKTFAFDVAFESEALDEEP